MAAIGDGPSDLKKEQLFATVEEDMEHKLALYDMVRQTCLEKCIERRRIEVDLNIGENSCVDRCVAKFLQVTNLVGKMLANR